MKEARALLKHDGQEWMMAQRRSIYAGGQGHGAHPIPAASIKGGFLASSAIYGSPPRSAQAIGLDLQCRNLFANIEEILHIAGGTLNDVIHMAIRLADPSDRQTLNEHWLHAFPDPASRPARHVDPEPMPVGARLISAEFLAIIEEN